jgi:hypothetical protein
MNNDVMKDRPAQDLEQGIGREVELSSAASPGPHGVGARASVLAGLGFGVVAAGALASGLSTVVSLVHARGY